MIMEYSKCKMAFGTLFMFNMAVRPMIEVGARVRLQERLMLYMNLFGISLLIEIEPLEEINKEQQ